MQPPVSPSPRLLPFRDPAFSWETFEAFFRDFLDALPKGLKALNGKTCDVVSAHLYGRKGGPQQGIDILARMSNGQSWVFQCKHCKEWTPGETRAAIAACTYSADRKFLLVTCEVSGKCRDAIGEHADWDIWDERDISSQFLQSLDKQSAARLLHTHFGPSWPKEMLEVSTTHALMGSEAFFATYLSAHRVFHHRLPLIGREDILQLLDAFMQASQAKVISLVGRGGLGKSRILLEWSRGFTDRHKEWSLRFLRDPTSNIAELLDGARTPMVLVIDDAHRWEGQRSALFHEAASRANVKLVLSLRPGPLEPIQLEILDAGVDSSEVLSPIRVSRLPEEQTAKLVETALGAESNPTTFHRLRYLARDCPLIAILAAELLKAGKLEEQSMMDTEDFQRRVFDGLLLDALPAETRFGARKVRDVLGLLALLAPVSPSSEFLKNAADFLGDATAPHHVAEILQAIEEAGLVVNAGQGMRVAPDLLSDHLAYSACYTRAGQSTTFVERVVQYFSPETFPQTLQHVAEAEWRALKAESSQQSVVEPLWSWFLGRFKGGSYFERSQAIVQWAKFAHFQPRRTLELARMAMQLQEASPYKYASSWGSKLDTHESVVEKLPDMLLGVAQLHPSHVPESLDLLWQIGRHKPKGGGHTDTHPINAIGKVASYQTWKKLEIQDAVLDWLERFLPSLGWLTTPNSASWVLEQILKPFFKTSIEENWTVGRTFSWRFHPLLLTYTAAHRERLRSICLELIGKSDERVTISVLKVLEHALARVHIETTHVPETYHGEWDNERVKALELLRAIAARKQPPMVWVILRRLVRNHLQHERSPRILQACRDLYTNVPVSLDVEILEAMLGSPIADFYRKSGRETARLWHHRMEGRWRGRNYRAAERLLHQHPTAIEVVKALDAATIGAKAHGLRADPARLMQEVARIAPARALQIADELLVQPTDNLAVFIARLIWRPTQNDEQLREAICKRALQSTSRGLCVGAITCLNWWRGESGLPETVWSLVQDVAAGATGEVALALSDFASTHRDLNRRDWDILVALASNTANHEHGLRLISAAASLFRHNPPGSRDQVRALLSAGVDSEAVCNGHEIYPFVKLSKQFPAEVFRYFYLRVERRREAEPDYEPIPHEFSQLRFEGLLTDSLALELVERLERRLFENDHLHRDEAELLNAVYLQTTEQMEQRLLAQVNRVTSPPQLERLVEFARTADDGATILRFPEFVRDLLIKARSFGLDVHGIIFARLSHISGSRGTGNGEPNEDWKNLIQSLQSAVELHRGDRELAAVYTTALSIEQASVQESRQRFQKDEEALDE